MTENPSESVLQDALSLADRSDAGVFLDTDQTALFAPDSDDAYRFTSSFEALRIFSAKYCRNKERRSGRVKECTHYEEVASYAVFFGKHLGIPDEVIAFIARSHDLPEDYPDVTPHMIVEECWMGDPKYADYIEKCIDLLTDPKEYRLTKEQKKNLSKEEFLEIKKKRLLSQIKAANEDDPTGVVALIRFCDKYCTLQRDYVELLNGNMPFGNEAAFKEYYDLRAGIVRQLHVPHKLKRLFRMQLLDIEDSLKSRKQEAFLRNEGRDSTVQTASRPREGKLYAGPPRLRRGPQHINALPKANTPKPPSSLGGRLKRGLSRTGHALASLVL